MWYVCSKNLKVLEFKHVEMRGFVWQSLEVQIDLEPDYILDCSHSNYAIAGWFC